MVVEKTDTSCRHRAHRALSLRRRMSAESSVAWNQRIGASSEPKRRSSSSRPRWICSQTHRSSRWDGAVASSSCPSARSRPLRHRHEHDVVDDACGGPPSGHQRHEVGMTDDDRRRKDHVARRSQRVKIGRCEIRGRLARGRPPRGSCADRLRTGPRGRIDEEPINRIAMEHAQVVAVEKSSTTSFQLHCRVTRDVCQVVIASKPSASRSGRARRGTRRHRRPARRPCRSTTGNARRSCSQPANASACGTCTSEPVVQPCANASPRAARHVARRAMTRSRMRGRPQRVAHDERRLGGGSTGTHRALRQRRRRAHDPRRPKRRRLVGERRIAIAARRNRERRRGIRPACAQGLEQALVSRGAPWLSSRIRDKYLVCKVIGWTRPSATPWCGCFV